MLRPRVIMESLVNISAQCAAAVKIKQPLLLYKSMVQARLEYSSGYRISKRTFQSWEKYRLTKLIKGVKRTFQSWEKYKLTKLIKGVEISFL